MAAFNDESTAEDALAAVQACAQDLRCVPARLMSVELCRVALEIKGEVLDCVPMAMRDMEMCEIAVANSGWALEHVPEPIRLAIVDAALGMDDPESNRSIEMGWVALGMDWTDVLRVLLRHNPSLMDDEKLDDFNRTYRPTVEAIKRELALDAPAPQTLADAQRSRL